MPSPRDTHRNQSDEALDDHLREALDERLDDAPVDRLRDRLRAAKATSKDRDSSSSHIDEERLSLAERKSD